jgi:hypothetical protein
MGTPADYTDDATTSTTARCFLELDPLVEVMCEGVGPPAWIVSVDPMLDKLVALSGPRGATTPPSGVPGKGKDGRPSLGHEAASDAAPTMAGQADHAGATGDQEGTEVPPSSPSKAHTTAVPSVLCMDAGPQAEAADGTTTGVV